MKCKDLNPMCERDNKCCCFCDLNKNGCMGCDEDYRECGDADPEDAADEALLK